MLTVSMFWPLLQVVSRFRSRSAGEVSLERFSEVLQVNVLSDDWVEVLTEEKQFGLAPRSYVTCDAHASLVHPRTVRIHRLPLPKPNKRNYSENKKILKRIVL